MKKILYILIPLAIVVAIVAKLAMNKQIAEDKVYTYDREQGIQVIAQKVSLTSVQPEYSFTGTFEPNRETRLSAEVQGKVNRVLVENGSLVREGQVLIQQDDALLQLQLKSAQVQIGGLEADLKRYRILVENDAIQGIQLEKTELALESAQIQISTLKEQISKSSIRAPFDGVVTAKLTEVGDFAAPGKPLLQVTDISKLKLTIQVPEQDLKLFEQGKEYQIQIPGLSQEANGKVNMVGSRGNAGNSFPVEIIISNTAKQEIKAGMFGELKMKTEAGQTGILISAGAILGSDLSPQVYLVKDGKAVLQNIQIGKRLQDQVLVSSGLREGDILIVGGLINVFEGANVTANF
jgi:membrane fusion protein (multidrug efflux system)